MAIACVRTSSNVTAFPPCLGSLSRVSLLWPILPEPQMGLHAGQHARGKKALRPTSIASDSLPHSVSRTCGLSITGAVRHRLKIQAFAARYVWQMACRDTVLIGNLLTSLI